MARHRALTTGTAAPTAVNGPELRSRAREEAHPAGERLLKRAALYARVSTETQEGDETIASQVDLLDHTAAVQGSDVAPGHVFIDDGGSGSRLDRPALDRLRDLAAEGAFEVIVVTAPERLARRYADQVVLVEELTRAGCEVVFAHQRLGTSPAEQMLLQRPGGFAEYERAVIQDRPRRGRLFAARQGRVNWGNPPYGYTSIRKTATTPQHLVVNEAEAEVVRQIYRWCVEEQLRSYAIHRRRTAQGIPPRKSVRGHGAHRRVLAILRDPLCKGEAYENRTQPGDVRRPYGPRGLNDRHPGNGQGRIRRPPADWMPGRVPALVDPETWERAQAQLVRKRARAPRHTTQHRERLRSLLVCGRCGRRMVGTGSAQGGRYICARRYPRYGPGACPGRRLGATTIEPRVWNHVKTLLSDPEVLQRQYEQGHGDPAVDVRAEQERARLERKLTALEREVTRLLDAYQAEVMELAELAERRHRIEDHGRMLRERVREIAQHRADRAAALRLLEGVDAFCASVRGTLEEPSLEVQPKVVQFVVNRIVVEDSRVIIEHVVPTGPVRLQPEHHAPENVRLVRSHKGHCKGSFPDFGRKSNEISRFRVCL